MKNEVFFKKLAEKDTIKSETKTKNLKINVEYNRKKNYVGRYAHTIVKDDLQHKAEQPVLVISLREPIKNGMKTEKIENKKVMCDQCEKSFSKPSNVYKHLKTVHYKIREFKCKCGKEYLHKRNFNAHILSCQELSSKKNTKTNNI
ncbi:hypothetical protein EDEG_01406 [Edhazardia aedis USNM 41457]|uniref:C2H2-type domain-containing protein n=1 Tax=Edhazardia aedis (strain USNM 41457) TaxID=1003232 RepID=J9DP63_EDHAE|nr:hypothetical protein EDEG_01406 [Edhazardia aedis USNM 41457]|eukprot:EJW04340.1 hypothetical protein EDEG_01406 [Edhazardia aedis USNM 41457]